MQGSILESLTIAKTLNNKNFSRIIEKAYIDIQAGNPIHRALNKESNSIMFVLCSGLEKKQEN